MTNFRTIIGKKYYDIKNDTDYFNLLNTLIMIDQYLSDPKNQLQALRNRNQLYITNKFFANNQCLYNFLAFIERKWSPIYFKRALAILIKRATILSNIVPLTILAPVKVSESNLVKIKEYFSTRSPNNNFLIINHKIDQSIGIGFIVLSHNKVYDFSLKNL